MILVASILGGALIGWILGWDRRAMRWFLAVWSAVFVVQKVLPGRDRGRSPPPDTGEWDVGYFPFALSVLALGLLIMGGTAALRRRRFPSEAPAES